jgi:hypothetical protein
LAFKAQPYNIIGWLVSRSEVRIILRHKERPMSKPRRDESKPRRDDMTSRQFEAATVVPFLRDQAFDPDTINLMSETIEKICGELHVKAQSPAGEAIAAQIIELVQRGVNNPAPLYVAAMSRLHLVN